MEDTCTPVAMSPSSGGELHVNDALAQNPAVLRALRRLQAGADQADHTSHYTKHSSYTQKHSSTW